ncbi:hypothetical protein GBA52_015262 [Prunus armeniaca]|nr:hypothetical protein GBA52_015262 [Prunus armeniaca]
MGANALRLEENLEKSPAFHKSFMSPDSKKPLHFVDFIRNLHQAGVKFHGVEFHKNGSRKNLFDIQFKKNTLEIPKIEIHDYTELTLRNLIAFEQCHCVDNKYITDYVFILDKFVNTPKDVELLVENRIVVNTLGDNNKVSIMINKLCSKVALNHGNYYFGDLAGKLNDYFGKVALNHGN